MVARAFAAGVPVGWVTTGRGIRPVDDATGVARGAGRVPYVEATRRNDDLATTATMGQARADELIAALPAQAWCRLSTRCGCTQVPRVLVGPGRRFRSPARCTTRARGTGCQPSCGISTGEIAYHILARDPAAPTVDLTRVAGTRWAIEECLQQAKNQAGLDQYQASNWRARMRPTPTPGARPGPPARGRWRAAVFARPVVGAGRSAGSTRPDPRTSEPSKVHRGWRDGRVRRCPPGHPLALCSPLLNTAWRVGARWSADDGWRRTGSSREYEGSCQRSTPR